MMHAHAELLRPSEVPECPNEPYDKQRSSSPQDAAGARPTKNNSIAIVARQNRSKMKDSIVVKTFDVQGLSGPVLAKLYRMVVKMRLFYLNQWNPAQKKHEMVMSGLTYEIAYIRNEIVGFLSWRPEDWENIGKVIYIWELHVLAKFKRRGIGRKLLSVTECKTRAPLLLRTFPKNAHAVAFYEQSGFEILPDISSETSLMMLKSHTYEVCRRPVLSPGAMQVSETSDA